MAAEDGRFVNSTSLSMATLENMSREGERERGREQSPFPSETRISLDQFATPPRCQAKHGEGERGMALEAIS